MKYSEEELIREIHRLQAEYQRIPTSSMMDNVGKYTARTYQLRFGSWNDALKKSGLGGSNNY